jgi:hypothetical protein
MAVRRDTVRKQFEDAVRPLLEPGEQPVAGAYGASGPNPLWLSGLFGLVGMIIANVRYYFVWVTDRRVLFLGASMMSGRPKGGLSWADQRSAVSVSEVTPAATWSWFKYHRPAGGKPIRLNFPRPWRDDFGAMTAALSGSAAPGGPVPPAPETPPAPPS